MAYCRNCGSEIPEGVKFCTNCGSAVDGGEVADGFIAVDCLVARACGYVECVTS